VLNLEVYYRYARIKKGLNAHVVGPGVGGGDDSVDADGIRPIIPVRPPEPTPAEALKLVDRGETRDRTNALRIVEKNGTREQQVEAVRKALLSDNVLCASNALSVIDRHKLWEATDELMMAYRADAMLGMRHMILATLGRLGADAIKAVPFLMEDPLRDPEDLISTNALKALRGITGQNFGASPSDWRRWWANRAKK
jgi:hypothetical protein